MLCHSSPSEQPDASMDLGDAALAESVLQETRSGLAIWPLMVDRTCVQRAKSPDPARSRTRVLIVRADHVALPRTAAGHNDSNSLTSSPPLCKRQEKDHPALPLVHRMKLNCRRRAPVRDASRPTNRTEGFSVNSLATFSAETDQKVRTRGCFWSPSWEPKIMEMERAA